MAAGVVDVGADPPDGEPQPPVDLAHPRGVPGGQVVVHRHHVDAAALQGVQVHGHGRDEGLALAGLHLGDPAEVQRHAAHQLDVEGALAEHPPGGLPDHREGLDQEVVEGLALVEALPELDRLVAEGVVVEALHLLFERVDERDQLGQAPDLLAFAGPQDLGQHAHVPAILPAATSWRRCGRGQR